MVPVVFLDCDGVINGADDAPITWLEHGEFGFYQTHLIDNLNRLLDEVQGLKIVFSSVWRLGKSVAQLQKLCDEIGIRGEVIGKTVTYANIRGVNTVRGNEIQAFIEENKELLEYEYYWEYKCYVILDDDSDMLYPQRHNFVKVNHDYGLTRQDVDKAIEILNREHPKDPFFEELEEF